MSGPIGPVFGDEVKRLRLERDWSQRHLATLVGMESGAFSRVENNHRTPSPQIVAALDTVLDTRGRLITLAAALFGSDVESVSAAAERSMAFAEEVGELPAGRLGVDSIAYELERIATSYVHAAPQPLFEALQRLRDQQWQMLRASPPGETRRDLVFLAGVTLVLLAMASGNLGEPTAAMQQALAADALAHKARHRGLLSWVAGSKALIAEWGGNPVAALNFAHEAAMTSPAGEQRARVAALEARCAARLGKVDDAREALGRALRAGETACGADEIGAFGGVLRFPPAKLAYYAGSTCQLIGDFARAEHHAMEAITAYGAGPAHEYSYGDDAIARTDVAIARLARGEFEGAGDILVPVLALPAGQRIHPVLTGLDAVGTRLQRMRTASTPPAAALCEEIATFSAPNPQALP